MIISHDEILFSFIIFQLLYNKYNKYNIYNKKINLFVILNNVLNKRTKLKGENESRVYYPLQYVNVGREVREFVRNIFCGLFNLLVFDKIIVSNRKSFSFIFSYYNLHCRYFLLLSLFRSIGVAINFFSIKKQKLNEDTNRIIWINSMKKSNDGKLQLQANKQIIACKFTIQRRSK